MSAHGLMFHHFYDHTHPKGQGAISADEFAQMLRFVGLSNILPAYEWMERALNGTLRDTDLCLTFDDALRCQYDIALPVLRDFGLTGFWFVYSGVFEGNLELLEIYRHFRTTQYGTVDDFYDGFFEGAHRLFPSLMETSLNGFEADSYLAAFAFYTRNDRIFRYLRDDVLGVERYNQVMTQMMTDQGYDIHLAAQNLWMDDAGIKTLHAQGHLVGLHSYTHPTRLAELTAHQQAQEYRRNYDHLSRVLGVPPVCMSHPCNSYAADTLDILDGLGIRLGFRSNMELLPSASMMEWPRLDHATILQRMHN